MGDQEQERLIEQLATNSDQLEEYKKPFDNYKTGLLPRFFGGILVGLGNLVYGEEPSYLKFRAVEVVARVPYHSWESAMYTMLTMFYSHEEKALKLATISRFARFAQDNETMHVVVVSKLAHEEKKANFILYTVIPVLFAFFYFWVAYFIYLLSPRHALELNYLFEQHAFDQYSRFIEMYEEDLKKKPIMSDFLVWYGRTAKNHYEFFQKVRCDELVHRNRSIREIALNKEARE